MSPATTNEAPERISPVLARGLAQALSISRGYSAQLSALLLRTSTMQVSEMSQAELDLMAEKQKLVRHWVPEYSMEEVRPPQDTPDVHSERATNVTLGMVLKEQPHLARKTKIICTAGPACWSEEGLTKLLEAGMNVLRLNFSHGDHKSHLEVLQRFRKVCRDKGFSAATLLDTKGPEIRTAMLRDHKPIDLVAGQSIIVEAVGARYTEFKGYKTETETRIGLSYDNLCQSVKPGNKILLADGSISITVEEILSNTELRGTVMNHKTLGERKNCNLPGVKVEIPVLTEKDIDDLQNFCVKHQMDFVAASFVQTAADVQFIRRVLDEKGGQHVKIICKIENMEGLINFDDILHETDGVMVARGDLGMEIPSAKVPVAQKLMVTKCNIAGKPVICATQMLESMIGSPRPTRAEMTDVANAVYDGVDCVMLSGESANGEFPDIAVSTMAAIVANAEVGVDYYSQYSFIKYWATKGNVVAMPSDEAILSSAASMAVGFTEDTTPEALKTKYTRTDLRNVIACVTKTGRAAGLIAKYRPPCPIIVVSTDEAVLRQCAVAYGMLPVKVDNLRMTADEVAKLAGELMARLQNKSMSGSKVIVALGCPECGADADPMVNVVRIGGLGSRDKAFSFGGNPQASSLALQRQGTRSLRSTFTNLPLITKPVTTFRNTHVVCTMGPKCWDAETLGKLLDAGMDIVRLNFSHGDHASHLEVLTRFRKVAEAKAGKIKADTKVTGPQWATLLDTKGPEIRTAMLRDHKTIDLVAGQAIIVEAVGARYTEFEGYKTETETRIGLSYDKLCQSVKPGNKILLADGSISIVVDTILSPTELQGTVLNSKSLGERKNCNLPGVKVDIPVLTAKDVDDLQNFCVKHQMDFVAVSFVQSGDDVRFVRRVLREAGGDRVKVISKIENAAGVQHYDDILQESDGIMVARGDLGMEIPAEKVPLAQKMLITKANIAGKFVITATQMLESMISNPRPTRAEMTDVANAVLDGTDAVMLSGETATGDFSVDAVATMSDICRNAEEMVNNEKRYNFIRNQTPKPMYSAEAVCSSAVQTALDCDAKAIICITASGRAPAFVSKYKPPQPVFVVTPDDQIIRHCRAAYGQEGIHYDNIGDKALKVTELVAQYARYMGWVDLQPGDTVVVIKRRNTPDDWRVPFDDQRLVAKAVILGKPSPVTVTHTAYPGKSIVYHRSAKISLGMILDDEDVASSYIRKTKILCTAGPACWSEEMLGKLLDAGMNILRLNFSHGDHKSHFEVLSTYRKVLEAKKVHAAALLDTKGPEIRTAMLRGHKAINLQAKQSIIIEAVGARYTEFEGYQTDSETRIGLSYEKLCQSVKPGNKILLADGSISITVEEILSPTELRGTVMNSKPLGERKNCNLPGIHVDIPVLTEKDVDDLQNFCAKHQMDFVAASFVQSKADVQFIRRVLDEAGGQHVKIICKIENAAGLHNFDEILEATDGIMVARGDLGMEIPVEKVPLAQKMMITKANISGKFVIVATQMMESMITNPIPTRAEMTDVANAVFDGTDCVMLSGESANGAYPDITVLTMSKICKSAENGINHYQVFDYIHSFTPKPVTALEAIMASLAKNAVDTRIGLIIVFSETGNSGRLLSKYRPCVPVLLVTSNAKLARACTSFYAVQPFVLDAPLQCKEDIPGQVDAALDYAVETGLCPPAKEVIVMTSTRVTQGEDDSVKREVMVTMAPGIVQHQPKPQNKAFDPVYIARTLSLRSTTIDVNMLFQDQATVRKTKIIVTVGPASSSPEVLERLVDEGMDVAVFRFTHGQQADHGSTLEALRKICAARGRTVATMLDLQGPEVRTSFLIDRFTMARINKLELTAGDPITLYGTDDLLENTFVGYRSAKGIVRLGVDFADLVDVVRPGSVLHLRDGAIGIRIDRVSRSSAEGVVLNSGTIGERKVVQIDGVSMHNTLSSEGRDMKDITEFAVEHGIDFVAVGKVRGHSDIKELRYLLDNIGCDNTKIVAKIETADGLRNLDDIIESPHTDAVVVARGNLGMEIACEKIALAQCNIISKAKVAGKPVIVARHMLESMNSNPRPTRAEMTDVANAVLDSADCIMLCSETATGNFPVETLVTASRICRNAEAAMNYGALHSFIRDFSPKPFDLVTAAAVALAKACIDAQVQLAMVLSNTGQVAQLVTKYRPDVPVVVITSQAIVAAQCNIAFGQLGFVVDQELMEAASPDEAIKRAVLWARAKGILSDSAARIAVMHGDGLAEATAKGASIKIMNAQALDSRLKAHPVSL